MNLLNQRHIFEEIKINIIFIERGVTLILLIVLSLTVYTQLSLSRSIKLDLIPKRCKFQRKNVAKYSADTRINLWMFRQKLKFGYTDFSIKAPDSSFSMIIVQARG